jgi:hypothetical protein
LHTQNSPSCFIMLYVSKKRILCSFLDWHSFLLAVNIFIKAILVSYSLINMVVDYIDCLCGLVVSFWLQVMGSIPGATRFSE